MNAVQACPYIFVGFSAIAAMTLFFSFYPRLFIKVFVPREDYRHAVRTFLREPDFARGMRFIAFLPFAMAILFGIAGIWMRMG